MPNNGSTAKLDYPVIAPRFKRNWAGGKACSTRRSETPMRPAQIHRITSCRRMSASKRMTESIEHHDLARGRREFGTRSSQMRGASQDQISVPSARVKASSTSTPRYLTVLSIFVCPSRIWIEVSGRLVDDRRLCPLQGVRAIIFAGQADPCDPFICQAGILAGAHVGRMIGGARHNPPARCASPRWEANAQILLLCQVSKVTQIAWVAHY